MESIEPPLYTNLHSDNQAHSNYILYFSTMMILAKLPAHDVSVLVAAAAATVFSMSTLLDSYSGFSSIHIRLSRPMVIRWGL